MTDVLLPRANVYNINNIHSPPDFQYFIDTNVLMTVFLKPVFNVQNYQQKTYPTFFKTLLRNRRTVFTFTQNIMELNSVLDAIEREEKGDKTIKNYRRTDLSNYLSTRRKIFEEIQNTLNIFKIEVTSSDIIPYFELDYSIDLNDFLFIEKARNPQTAFVTDDGEFIFAEGINVFTANRTAITSADRCKRLMNP